MNLENHEALLYVVWNYAEQPIENIYLLPPQLEFLYGAERPGFIGVHFLYSILGKDKTFWMNL